MMFAGTKLPSKLQRAVSNLSTTVQVLLSEIVLAVEGLDDRARSEAGKIDYAHKNKRATQLREQQLTDFLNARRIGSEDAAIAVSASAGRSTREIAEFLGIDQLYAMRRLCAVRKQAAVYKEKRQRIRETVQLCFSFFRATPPTQDEADVLEVFAEAARK